MSCICVGVLLVIPSKRVTELNFAHYSELRSTLVVTDCKSVHYDSLYNKKCFCFVGFNTT